MDPKEVSAPVTQEAVPNEVPDKPEPVSFTCGVAYSGAGTGHAPSTMVSGDPTCSTGMIQTSNGANFTFLNATLSFTALVPDDDHGYGFVIEDEWGNLLGASAGFSSPFVLYIPSAQIPGGPFKLVGIVDPYGVWAGFEGTILFELA